MLSALYWITCAYTLLGHVIEPEMRPLGGLKVSVGSFLKFMTTARIFPVPGLKVAPELYITGASAATLGPQALATLGGFTRQAPTVDQQFQYIHTYIPYHTIPYNTIQYNTIHTIHACMHTHHFIHTIIYICADVLYIDMCQDRVELRCVNNHKGPPGPSPSSDTASSDAALC